MCPHRYEKIRDSIRAQHPDKPLAEVKRIAAATYEKTKKPGEMHIQTAVARERAKKVKGIGHRRHFTYE